MDQLIVFLKLIGALVNIAAGVYRILSTASEAKQNRAEGR